MQLTVTTREMKIITPNQQPDYQNQAPSNIELTFNSLYRCNGELGERGIRRGHPNFLGS